jgi:hypothetical protein
VGRTLFEADFKSWKYFVYQGRDSLRITRSNLLVPWQRSYNLSLAEFESVTNAPEPERGWACHLLYAKAYWRRNEMKGGAQGESLATDGAGTGGDGRSRSLGGTGQQAQTAKAPETEPEKPAPEAINRRVPVVAGSLAPFIAPIRELLQARGDYFM